MLLKVRESMKGTFVAGVVILFFIVPLVLTGVDGGSFLGSAAGTDAASVDGKDISNAELRRAVYMRKQRLLSQEGVDANADYLKDENLRGPVLENLTRRAALVVSAQKGGMGVADETLDDRIRKSPEFQQDGKFDQESYRRLLSNLAFSPATYKVALAEDTLVGQHARGIQLSAFATESELNGLISLIQQKRSFFTINVPKTLVEKTVNVTDEDINAYYEANKDSFVEPEQLSAEYVELSADAIAETLEIAPEDVRAKYEEELKQFEKTQEYIIAHILLEDNDNQDNRITEVSEKIKAGEDFTALATQYSDDGGSKENGGNLGVLIAGSYPEAFEEAAFALNEGEVSEPVETDAGVHFIKVVSKTVSEPPSFELRKANIESEMKLSEAETIYAENFDSLGELTFSADDLTAAAEALNIEVKTTPVFTRARGTGVAGNASFRDAAFSDEVLKNGYNSSVIEFSNTRSVVLRKAVHTPERIKSLDEMKEQITATLTKEKVDEALTKLSSELKDKLASGENAEEAAKASEYAYKAYDKAARASSDASFQVASKAFSMELTEGAASYDHIVDRDGSHVVVGLTEIVAGTRADMQDQQFKGLSTQLNIQNAAFETAAYESQVLSDADIDIY